jgi:hypothetical protein
MAKKQVGGSSGKKGRMKIWCAAYSASHRYEKNKKRKILKHLKKFPADKVAENALTSLIW